MLGPASWTMSGVLLGKQPLGKIVDIKPKTSGTRNPSISIQTSRSKGHPPWMDDLLHNFETMVEPIACQKLFCDFRISILGFLRLLRLLDVPTIRLFWGAPLKVHPVTTGLPGFQGLRAPCQTSRRRGEGSAGVRIRWVTWGRFAKLLSSWVQPADRSSLFSGVHLGSAAGGEPLTNLAAPPSRNGRSTLLGDLFEYLT